MIDENKLSQVMYLDETKKAIQNLMGIKIKGDVVPAMPYGENAFQFFTYDDFYYHDVTAIKRFFGNCRILFELIKDKDDNPMFEIIIYLEYNRTLIPVKD